MAQAKATHPDVRGSGDDPSYYRTAGMTGQEPEGSEHVAQAKATHPEVGGSGDGSLILPHAGMTGHDPEAKPKQLTQGWEAVARGRLLRGPRKRQSSPENRVKSGGV